MNKIAIELDDTQAEALAQFCKRSFIDRVRPFSEDEEDAWRMVYAIQEFACSARKSGVGSALNASNLNRRQQIGTKLDALHLWKRLRVSHRL
ncbi:hypothetical protein AB4Z52_29485 [Rhizobium sp. 2YAF20]|uniref:DUF7706 family protein n=1 Tax=Rhizobium sp. 2YAF20 TaxID=3233027 RepID=UPI003F9C0F40